MDALTIGNHVGEDLPGVWSPGDLIGSFCVILPLAVNLVVMITMALRGKGVDQEEEEDYFIETDTNNNKIEFPVNQSHRQTTTSTVNDSPFPDSYDG